MKRKKLRIFPVISLVVIIIVVLYAISLIVKVFDNGDSDEKPKAPNVQDEVASPEDPHVGDVLDEIPAVKDEPIVYEEDLTDFEEDAPRPVYTHSQLMEMYPDAVLGKTEDAGQSYINDMIFIGDSTTHGMAFYGVLEGGKETKQVWTPKSGTLAMWNLLTENIVYPDDGSEMLIGDAIGIKCPKIVVLTLGVNGVSSLTEEQFKGYYVDLINLIKEKSPDTKIITQSIYPVCDYYEMKSISMEKINRANSWIAEIASENGAYYLNTITALVNEAGYLNNDYCNGDGIHISKSGFNVILDYIRTHSIE